MDELISIIINCHNGEKFLKKCLNSIIQQTYKNWEVIFWDNCSTDRSKNIYNDFNDKRFKYFKSNNLTNLSTARNLAIKESNGRYVCFLDTDDFWEPTKLNQQLKIIKKKQFALVYSNFLFKNFKNNKVKLAEKSINNLNVINNFLKKYPVSISSVMFDKKLISDIYFDENYHCIGDFDFVMRTILKHNIFGIQQPLITVLIHDNNETQKRFKLYTLELIKWYKKTKNKFLNFENIKVFRSNIYYEMSKLCLKEKKYKSFSTLFKKMSLSKKIKIIIIFFSKKLNLSNV